jgi:hypothetical protein
MQEIEMSQDHDFRMICSVTEMARKLRLSRARFYQLQNMGVFPAPVYRRHTRRPFYPRDLQEQCLAIRKTGIGANGQPVLFNASRKRAAGRSQTPSAQEHRGLVEALGQMGLNVSDRQVAEAVEALYPQGLTEGWADGTTLRSLFQYFERRR